jgi:hypothetical protein
MALANKWKDLILPITSVGPGGSNPAATTLLGNVQVYGFQTGDLIQGSFEIQHDYIEGTDLNVHVHWAPSTSNTGAVVFNFEYTVANVGAVYPATTILNQPFTPSGVQAQHQLSAFTTTIPGTGRKIGDVVCFRFLRNATGNAFTGLALVTSIGVHYQCDCLGSNQIVSKN